MIPEGDYVLGTHDEEIEQLGLQHQAWQWPKAFPQVGLRRLVDLGLLAPDRARAISAAVSACGSAPHTLVITRAVLEVIAVRR